MPLPLALPLILAMAGSGLSIGAKAGTAKTQRKFEEEQEKAVKAEQEKRDKEARQAALSRAVGGAPGFRPRPGFVGPEAPDLTKGQTIAGIGDLLAQLGSAGLARTRR